MREFFKLIDFHNWKHLLLITNLIVGLLFAVLFPPFQKPDEYVHFFRAATLASGSIHCTPGESMAPKPFVDLANRMHSLQIEHHSGAKFPLKEFLVHPLISRGAWGLQEKINYDICNLPVVSYVPHAAVLRLAMLVQMNAFVAFLFGRLAVFVVAYAIVLYLYSKSKGVPQVCLLLAFSLPMTLHQLTAYSYDVANIVLGFSTFYLATKYVEQSIIKKRDLLIFAITLLLFLLVKSGYEAFLLLPLIFIGSKIEGVSKHWKYIIPIAIFTAITFLYLGFKQISSPLPTVSSETKGSGYIYSYLQLKQLSQKPHRLPEMLLTTLDNTKEEYVIGTIAHFGWRDFYADYSIYLFFLFLAAYICFSYKVPRKVKIITPIIFVLIVGITISLVVTSMYIFWTPVGLPTSYGTQGRYFIVLVPLFLYSAIYLKRYFSKRHSLLIIPLLFYLFFLGRDIYRRYYDYSVLLDQEEEKTVILERQFGDAKAVLDSVQQQVSINPGKKLRGFRLFSSEKQVTYPHVLEVYDQSCTQKLREVFLDIQQSEGGEIRTFFRPLESHDTVCVTVKPYEGNSGQEPLRLLIDKEENLLLEPLYLR